MRCQRSPATLPWLPAFACAPPNGYLTCLVFQDVKADLALAVDVAVINPRAEDNLHNVSEQITAYNVRACAQEDNLLVITESLHGCHRSPVHRVHDSCVGPSCRQPSLTFGGLKG